MSSKDFKDMAWNAVLGAIGIAVIGMMGWQALTIIRLENQLTGVKATRFTKSDGNKLDKRIAIVENDLDWVRRWVFSKHGETIPEIE